DWGDACAAGIVGGAARARLAFWSPAPPTPNPRSTPTYADRAPHDAPVDRLQRVYDLRVVRPSQAPATPPLDHRRPHCLGHRALRVPVAGPREPHRIHGALTWATEDAAGGHHLRSLHSLRHLVYE